MARGKKSKRLDWAKFTNFKARKSLQDLQKLCRDCSKEDLRDVLGTVDETGLYPIHWAAIHNRSDLIAFMLENGCPIGLRCKNKLFADGSTMHLATMNGALEVVSLLVSEYGKRKQNNEERQTKEDQSTSSAPKQYDRSSDGCSQDWKTERDSEGQTALMRSAAPKSRRLELFRDLLGKNLWSLSARPAEMVLFLISKGADWRDTDTKFGMNLMHLAIVNDHDDIVNLLLVIDRPLINIATKTTPSRGSKQTEGRENNTNFVTIDLDGAKAIDSGQESSPNVSSDSSTEKPLISDRSKTEDLIASGLKPLQLAILYGRISIIGLLWYVDRNIISAADGKRKRSRRKWLERRLADTDELKRILWRACWSNKNELSKLLKTSLLKLALVLDIFVLSLLWMPHYLMNSGIRHLGLSARTGVFIVSFFATLAMAFRVMTRNPGFLRRCSIQYIHELHMIIRKGQGRNKSNSSDRQGNREREARETNDSKAEISLQTESGQKTKDKDIESSEKIESDQSGDLLERVRLLCHKCRCVRRPRSRHCNYCNHCVQDFDHHCIYLGCCVGRGNRLDFLLMLIMTSITSIYGTVLHSVTLDRREWGIIWHTLGLIWILKYAVIGTVSTFFLLRRACSGVTMYEEVRSRRIRDIFEPDGPPEEISRSHQRYRTYGDTFWRYSPDRFLTGDLPARKILYNLREFTNFTTLSDYLLMLICSDTSLVRSISRNDSKLNLDEFV